MRSVLPFYLRIAALGAAIALPPLPALSEDALSPAAQRGFVDEVIMPRQTRAKLIAALEALDTKRDRNPPKKHGNIPL